QSPLTLRDIDAICQACTTVLNGVFHERIEYPDPPAAIKKAGTVKKPIIVTTKDAEEPWDGESEQIDAAAPEKDPLPPPDSEPEGSTPVIVAPEQFEPGAPLVVVPPTPEAVLSVDDILNMNDEDEPDDPNYIQQEFNLDAVFDEDDEEIIVDAGDEAADEEDKNV
ncbi:MAG: hypothetical protein IJA59_02260, partial [Clostridia bacterium]|nr:hypothetical protein [Clostridia bacterium]